MSRYHRENPDAPIVHDAFEGVQITHQNEEKPEVCSCGNKPTGYFVCNGKKELFCSKCDTDPPIDLGHQCYSCGKPSHRQEYIGSGIDLGVCAECDTGRHLGPEHLGG